MLLWFLMWEYDKHLSSDLFSSHPLVTSTNLIALNTVYFLMTPKYVSLDGSLPDLRFFICYFLFNISTWVSDGHLTFVCPNLISSSSPLNLFFQWTPTLTFQLLCPKTSVSPLTPLVLSQSITHQIANSSILKIYSEHDHFTTLPPGPTYYVLWEYKS